jgi:4-aminobutyrate aminotransferase-like enzyme
MENYGVHVIYVDVTKFFCPFVHMYRMLLKHQIMIKEDGLDHNVIKIKPPLCFTKENADTLVQALEDTLKDLGK